MAIDAAEYRNVIGNFATGVTVVTTCVDGMMHGMTANAVTSVSLEPLLLLVCVARGARAHGELERAAHFGVSVLSAAQQDVSNTFASSGEPESGSLRGVAFRAGKTGAPLLEGSLACLECEIDGRLDGGDHTIVLGRVLDGEILSDEAPLLYFRGKYARTQD